MKQIPEPAEIEEDLREFYITPEYLNRMKKRAELWDTGFLKFQAGLFQKTLPDYPELVEVLEKELHKRNLNQLLRSIRKNPGLNLKALLKKYKNIPDYAEIIRTEMEIQSGVERLHDPVEGGGARIV